MKNFKNHQRPCRKYRFDILGHKKALQIWWDSTFNKKNVFTQTVALEAIVFQDLPDFRHVKSV